VNRARERVMLYGPPKVGKTKAAVDVIRKQQDVTCWVIDADNAWEAVLDAHKDVKVREEWWGGEKDDTYVDEDGNVVLLHTRTWTEHLEAWKYALENAERDDWIIVDSITHFWEGVMEWYMKKVHGEDLPDFLLEHRVKQVETKQKATQGQDAVLVEWNFLNPLWNREIAEPIVNSPCHLLLLCEAKELRSDGRNDKGLVDMYGEIGWRPTTQKRMGHQVRTTIFVHKAKVGDVRWRLTTAGDREREELENAPWKDWFMVYLKGVAGWKMQKDKEKKSMEEEG